MKKVSLLLVFILLFHGIAFAYSDVFDTQLSEKIKTLSNYNVINGYEDGTFRPNNNITRAEFCKLITCATMNDYVDHFNNEFTDVKSGFWAEHYIYAAKSLGIVNGTTQTTFDPNANITNEQAVKMIVCALGYSEEANSAGGYPNGHIKIASDLGIISLTNFNSKAITTRKNIVEMVYNALDVEYYFISLNEDGILERSKSESTLREFHEFLNTSNDDFTSDTNEEVDYTDSVG